jgi:hypothetical protein|tara:strand:+ start:168 stop:632 length:465 start_codon:yes stop_codon:yes gene_type:complete
MITLLGSLLGFGTSFLPEVLNYFKRGQEQKHELQRMKMEIELMAKRSEFKIQELDKEAEIKEAEGLYKHDSVDAGGFINALRGSVRPIITYAFFGLFVAIKVTALISLMSLPEMQLNMALSMIWDDQTAGLFSAIMAFWFGNRAVSKYYKTKGA